MKKEMTVEERAAAKAELETKKVLLQTILDNVRAAEEVQTQKRREHRLALEEEASRILSAALPTMPNAGAIVASVEHEWALGEAAKARLKIDRPDQREHGFEVTIKDGSLHRYSAWSQSGNAEDARETITYYEIVSTMLHFVTAPENAETLKKICEIVNTPYEAQEEQPQLPDIAEIRAEIQGIDDEIRKLEIYVGAGGRFRRPYKGIEVDIVVTKVTPKTFTYETLNADGEATSWSDSGTVKIGDKQFKFGVAA